MQLQSKINADVKWVWGLMATIFLLASTFLVLVPIGGFLMGQMREGYSGAVVYNHICLLSCYIGEKGELPNSKEDIINFVKNHEDPQYRRQFGDIISKGYPVKWDYEIINQKENEAIFLLFIDSSRTLWGLTYKGSASTVIGKVNKNEKGEWYGVIESYLLGDKCVRNINW